MGQSQEGGWGMHSLLGRETLDFPLALGMGPFNLFQAGSWVTRSQHWTNRFAGHPKYKCSKEPNWVRWRHWTTCLELPKISQHIWLITRSSGNRVFFLKTMQNFFRGNGDKPTGNSSFSHWIELSWALYLTHRHTPVWLDTQRICLQYRSPEDPKLRISFSLNQGRMNLSNSVWLLLPHSRLLHSLLFLHLHTLKATQRNGSFSPEIHFSSNTRHLWYILQAH